MFTPTTRTWRVLIFAAMVALGLFAPSSGAPEPAAPPKPAAPAAKADEPAAKEPEAPAAKPEEAAAKEPEEPAAKPEEAAAKEPEEPAKEPEEPVAKRPEPPYRAALVPLAGVIEETLRTSAMNRAEEAIADGATLLIFHITSNGGTLLDGLELSREIERLARRPVRTVAFVDAKAYSAATLAALACQEIVMTPEAEIGDCAPILVGPSGPITLGETEREKQESPIRERMESMAERNGYPPALARAMVSRHLVVVEARHAQTGEVRYVEEDELFALGPEWEKGKVVVSADELLTVSAQKAKRYGFAREVVDDLDALYRLYAIEGRVAYYPVTQSEIVVMWLNSMWVKSLLVLIGLLGIYIEMNTPGFGVPGTIGLVCFGIVFAASFLAGRPHWLPILLFAAGGAMLAVEVFVTPGFGLLGGSGILLLLVSIVLVLPRSLVLPSGAIDWDAIGNAVGLTVAVLAVFALAALALGRFFPRVPLLRRVVLEPSVVSDGSSRAAAARIEAAARVGEVGRAMTKLRPAGKVMFGERLVDVMTEGDFLEAGQAVEVIEVRGNRILVKPVGGEGPRAEA